MIDLNEKFGIDSKKLLNVVYDKTNDFLYVGSKDNGFYEIQLNESIVYDAFENKKVLGFEDNLILDQSGVEFTFKDNGFKRISKSDFKDFQERYSSKGNLQQHTLNRDNFELNFNLKANELEFYDLVKHKNEYFVSSNIGIFTVNKNAEIINYIPIHTYNFGFTANNSLYETHPYGATRIYKSLDNLEIKSVSSKVSDIVASINLNETTFFCRYSMDFRHTIMGNSNRI